MNTDQLEIQKFSELAHNWWDPNGEFKTLHDINPLRLRYIDEKARLKGKTVLDIGCGGGILSESMAQCGARVTGIDMSEKVLEVAKLHLYESGQQVDYRLISAEEIARERPNAYDVVTCMELLEHIPDPGAMVKTCASLVKPGGFIFFSTLNRNLKSYLLAVIGAEYILRMLPRGTHDYTKFITPAELAKFCRDAGLAIEEIIGMTYNPLSKVYSLSRDTDVNYIMSCQAE